MIKIKRNVKRGERRKLGIKRSSKSKERAWAAKFRSKSALAAKISSLYEMISQPPILLCENPPSSKFSPRCGNDFQASKGAAKMFIFSPLVAKMAFGIEMG